MNDAQRLHRLVNPSREQNGERQMIGILMDGGEEAPFLLAGQPIRRGTRIAVRILSSWVSGQVEQDLHGWYLSISERVGIRLSAGLTVQWEGAGATNEQPPAPLLQ